MLRERVERRSGKEFGRAQALISSRRFADDGCAVNPLRCADCKAAADHAAEISDLQPEQPDERVDGGAGCPRAGQLGEHKDADQGRGRRKNKDRDPKG
jgi:hypothetical protein